MQEWIKDIEFETVGTVGKLLKTLVTNPIANHTPPKLMKKFLRDDQCELALSNWRDPGGWRSMVISYDPTVVTRTWDKILVKAGTMPKALRNRRKLAARLISKLLDECPNRPAHALCLGAGPGHIITDAMMAADKKDCKATLVDISSDAFDYGRQLAKDKGVADRVEFIQGDVREVRVNDRVDVVKMIGICEYLTDEQLLDIAKALQAIMPKDAAMVFNSISDAHGTDRFFRRVFGLNMIYRSPQELEAIFSQAGFGDYTACAEPLGVYNVVGARMVDPKN